MLTVITDTATLAAAQQTFRENLLAAMPQRITCTVSGVGGGFSTEVAYTPEWDLWTRNKYRTKNAGMVLALVRLSRAKKWRLPQKSISRQKD